MSLLQDLYIDNQDFLYVYGLMFTRQLPSPTLNYTTYVLKIDQAGNLVGNVSTDGRGYSMAGDTENNIILPMDNQMFKYSTNGDLLSVLNYTCEIAGYTCVFTEFSVDTDGWMYGKSGSPTTDNILVSLPNGTNDIDAQALYKTEVAVGITHDHKAIVFEGKHSYTYDRNATVSPAITLPFNSSIKTIAQVPGEEDTYYLYEAQYRTVWKYNSTQNSIVDRFQPPDWKWPVTSITADDAFVYLGLDSSQILKINATNGRGVKLIPVGTNGFAGLKRHPVNGDLYFLDHGATATATVPTSSSSTWDLVRLDSNLVEMSSKQIPLLTGVNMLPDSPFVFDRTGKISIYVPSKSVIAILGSGFESGDSDSDTDTDSSTSISLASTPLQSTSPSTNLTAVKIWVDQLSLLYISDSASNTVYCLDDQANIMNTYNVSRPSAVAVNSYGYVFIISDHQNVVVFAPDNTTGPFVSSVLGPNYGSNPIVSVRDIWIDRNDNVYIGRHNDATVVLYSKLTPRSPSGNNSNSSDTNAGMIAGIVIAVFVALILVVLVVLWRLHRRRAFQMLEDESEKVENEGHLIQLS